MMRNSKQGKRVYDIEKAGSSIFGLIQLARAKAITDITTAMGIAEFYLYFKKYMRK